VKKKELKMSLVPNDFLLENKLAKKLYNKFAKDLPIIDYHCHIDPGEIYANKRFENISEVWLGGDHYKWRLMRSRGVSEDYITGNSSGKDKFKAFASILPYCIGNPVYHWAHLELQRFFDCYLPLCSATADEIWELTKDKLAVDDTLSPLGIINRMNVEVVVTTDDPADNLEWHRKLKSEDGPCVRVLPCWRPDAVMNIDSNNFRAYIGKLGESAAVEINNYDTLKAALIKRLEHFGASGCKTADHGIGKLVYAPCSDNEAAAIFDKVLQDDLIDADGADKYRYALLTFLAEQYKRQGWVMQLHLGVIRDVNTLMSGKLGANTGFDSIGPFSGITDLEKVLDALNSSGSLPKTLIFPINPNDNAAVNTIAGCFNEPGIKSKVQQGSAWWFNDTIEGMEQQLISFAQFGVLSNFVGMLTDSRSFMSYTRHEYFRRILCNLIGKYASGGKFPDDTKLLGNIVQDICYNNAKEFFKF